MAVPETLNNSHVEDIHLLHRSQGCWGGCDQHGHSKLQLWPTALAWLLWHNLKTGIWDESTPLSALLNTCHGLGGAGCSHHLLQWQYFERSPLLVSCPPFLSTMHSGDLTQDLTTDFQGKVPPGVLPTGLWRGLYFEGGSQCCCRPDLDPASDPLCSVTFRGMCASGDSWLSVQCRVWPASFQCAVGLWHPNLKNRLFYSVFFIS